MAAQPGGGTAERDGDDTLGMVAMRPASRTAVFSNMDTVALMAYTAAVLLLGVAFGGAAASSTTALMRRR
eukprot:3698924-Alexandrium_andersonii.AAC.1